MPNTGTWHKQQLTTTLPNLNTHTHTLAMHIFHFVKCSLFINIKINILDSLKDLYHMYTNCAHPSVQGPKGVRVPVRPWYAHKDTLWGHLVTYFIWSLFAWPICLI